MNKLNAMLPKSCDPYTLNKKELAQAISNSKYHLQLCSVCGELALAKVKICICHDCYVGTPPAKKTNDAKDTEEKKETRKKKERLIYLLKRINNKDAVATIIATAYINKILDMNECHNLCVECKIELIPDYWND